MLGHCKRATARAASLRAMTSAAQAAQAVLVVARGISARRSYSMVGVRSSAAAPLASAALSSATVTPIPVLSAARRTFVVSGKGFWRTASAADKAEEARRAAGVNIPAGTEGVPFRLSPDDAMEAYSKWFWRKTPFFRPKSPKSLTPLSLPFWAFTFKVTVRHRPSGTERVIDYDQFDRSEQRHGIFADARMRASQVYAGYEFTREMVDIIKAPANLAHPWSPDFLTPPQHHSHGLFAFRPPDYASRFDPRRAERFAAAHLSRDTWSRARQTVSRVFRPPTHRQTPAEAALQWGTGAAADAVYGASDPGALFKGSRRTDAGLSLEYEEEGGGSWLWRGRRLVVRRDPADSAGGEGGSAIERAALRTVNALSWAVPMSSDRVRLVPPTPPLGPVQTDEFVMLEATALLQAEAAVRRTEMSILQYAGQLAPDGSLAGPAPSATKEGIAAAAQAGHSLAPGDFRPDDYEITVESPLSRRLLLPGYRSVYSHMFSDWEVYTSAVTGRSFGLQQSGVLEAVTRGATIAGAWMTGAGLFGQSLSLARAVPVLSKLLALGAGVYGLKSKFGVFMLRRALDASWAQTRSEELKVRDLLMAHTPEGLSGAAVWKHKPDSVAARMFGGDGRARWLDLQRRDVSARAKQAAKQQRVKDGFAHEAAEEARAEAARAEAARRHAAEHQQQQQQWQQEQQRQQQERAQRERERAEAEVRARARAQEQAYRAEQQKKDDARKAQRVRKPPAIPNDVYEVLGLPRPLNHAEASRITMAQIRNGYRTQLMKYHPDFHREDTAEFSLAYANLRTQAIVEAHNLVKTDALKTNWDKQNYARRAGVSARRVWAISNCPFALTTVAFPMVAETAKQAVKDAVLDAADKWNPTWKAYKSDMAEATETLIDRGKNVLLDTGRGIADRGKDAMARGKDAVARGVARGVDASSEALQAAFDKLSGPAQFFFTYIFDQTAGTQLTRCLFFTFALQLLAGFVPHAFFGKERHYHMLGGANFIILTLYTLFTQPDWGLRKLIVSSMVCAWAARLMTYLYRRDGNTVDKRFAGMRNRPALKLVYWLGQAAWVSACMLPVILMNSEDTPQASFALPGKTLPRTVHTPLGDVNLPAFLGSIRGPARRGLWGRFSWHNLTWLDYIGFAVFAAGFALESVADWQKAQFHSRVGAAQRPAEPAAQQQQGQQRQGQQQGQGRQGQSQQGQAQEGEPADAAPKFLRTGLWKFSRHPNYLGEIMVWCGIYLSCFSALSGWQHIAVLSPLATVLTITSLTGIPYSEDGKERQFGALPAYQEYKQKTPLLVPGLF